jgi:hypothetical protein
MLWFESWFNVWRFARPAQYFEREIRHSKASIPNLPGMRP